MVVMPVGDEDVQPAVGGKLFPVREQAAVAAVFAGVKEHADVPKGDEKTAASQILNCNVFHDAAFAPFVQDISCYYHFIQFFPLVNLLLLFSATRSPFMFFSE